MISPRKGFALAAALLVLLLVSALVTGVFVATTEETKVGIASVERHRLLAAAESAIEMTVAGFSADTTPIGVAGTEPIPIGDLEAPVIVYVTRLDSALYWIVADAGASPAEATASRRIGVMVRAVAAPDHSTIIDRISERWWSELF